MHTKKHHDMIQGLAGLIVVVCLFVGLAAQYPGPAKVVGVVLGLTWGITRLIGWKGG